MSINLFALKFISFLTFMTLIHGIKSEFLKEYIEHSIEQIEYYFNEEEGIFHEKAILVFQNQNLYEGELFKTHSRIIEFIVVAENDLKEVYRNNCEVNCLIVQFKEEETLKFKGGIKIGKMVKFNSSNSTERIIGGSFTPNYKIENDSIIFDLGQIFASSFKNSFKREE